MENSKKMKILFDATPLMGGKSGVGYYTQELTTALAEVGAANVEIVGYVFNFLGRKSLNDLPDIPGVRYKEIKAMPGRVMSICRRLGFQPPIELFIRDRVDLLLFPNFVALPTIRKTKRAAVIYDLCFIDCPEYVAIKNRTFLQRWVPRTVRSVDMVITISEFIKKRVKEEYGLSDSKIHITPIPPMKNSSADNSILRAHGLGNGYILFVGTIEPRKNILGLLNGYVLLPSHIRDKYPLVLAGGKGWHDDETLARIEELKLSGNNIVLTGYITDSEKSALYESATVCVQPSHYEGFGMPVLEAMSHGKSVVCSDIEVLHEVAGNAALYFDKDSPADIARVLSALIEDPSTLAKYSVLSLEHIAKYPKWNDVATNLYEKISKLTR